VGFQTIALSGHKQRMKRKPVLRRYRRLLVANTNHKQIDEPKFQCTFAIKAIATFTKTHCSKDCQWLVYGHVNVLPLNHVGVCCCSMEVLELDLKTNEFKRTAKCIEVANDC
jgi:hypothetical protein